MPIEFRENKELGDDDITIIVEAAHPTSEVLQVIRTIEAATQRTSPTLAVDTGNRLEIVRKTAILAIEVHNEMLVIRTRERSLTCHDRLYRFAERLPSPQFIQISRQVIINLEHLQSLEASYSGNMTAHLAGGLTETVSRRYVSALQRALGE